MDTTPVLLLTGYLGSGKTTLLNRILHNREGIRFAVIVNDIGEVNIDAEMIAKGGLVSQQDDSLVALQNGCICCTLKMDLVEQLRDITQAGTFDYIVIEASGICEPGPIAQTICSIPQLTQWPEGLALPRLDCIASVVDALRLKDEFQGGLDLLKPRDEEDIENLVIQQIEFCNIILLNKASDVDPSELERTKQVLRGLQPKAEIIPCDYADVPLEKLLHTSAFDFERTATSSTWVEEIEKHHHEHEHEEHEHHHHEHHHHEHHHHEHGEGCTCGHCHHDHDHEHAHGEEYGIGTYVFYSRKPFSLSRFDHFVAKLWPKNVIRAKGMCWFATEPHTSYHFEQAGKQVKLSNAGQWYATMPADELRAFLESNPQLQADWDPEVGDRQQKLVFIGTHLDRPALHDLLEQCCE